MGSSLGLCGERESPAGRPDVDRAASHNSIRPVWVPCGTPLSSRLSAMEDRTGIILIHVGDGLIDRRPPVPVASGEEDTPAGIWERRWGEAMIGLARGRLVKFLDLAPIGFEYGESSQLQTNSITNKESGILRSPSSNRDGEET